MSKKTVYGWKHSKGDFEGASYDYVVLYCVSRLKKSDNQAGSAGVEIRGEPHLVEKLQKIDFSVPVECEVEIEEFATGKGGFQNIAVALVPKIVSKAV